MKLATHRTTTVPRKGPTIVQKYKKHLATEAQARTAKEARRAEDDATRDHLGITRRTHHAGRCAYFTQDKRDYDDLCSHRLAQALQGPQIPDPQVTIMHTKPVAWWKALMTYVCQ